MSEKDPREGKPIDPELVEEDGSEAPRSGGLRRIERKTLDRPETATLGSILDSLFRSPKREARQARDWADTARAHTELDTALTDLGRSRQKLRSLPKIIAADEEQRDIDLMRLQNQRAEEERIAKQKALQDELAEEEIRAKIAEARRRRREAENPALPSDEDSRRREAVAKRFRERMGRRFTEQEVRAYAVQLISEIRQRAGGDLTAAVQREIDNVTDAMNSLLDEL
jgi:hypothetical protein